MEHGLEGDLHVNSNRTFRTRHLDTRTRYRKLESIYSFYRAIYPRVYQRYIGGYSFPAIKLGARLEQLATPPGLPLCG